MQFDEAFDLLIGHEGNYINDPKDPGGETNWGISKRSYPQLDIKNLTKEAAKNIYWKDYWVPSAVNLLPDTLIFDVFDTAVNSGPKTAIKIMQKMVGTVQDGVIGPKTLAAIKVLNDANLVYKYNANRLLFMTDLPNWRDAGKGWARRIAYNILRN